VDPVFSKTSTIHETTRSHAAALGRCADPLFTVSYRVSWSVEDSSGTGVPPVSQVQVACTTTKLTTTAFANLLDTANDAFV